MGTLDPNVLTELELRREAVQAELAAIVGWAEVRRAASRERRQRTQHLLAECKAQCGRSTELVEQSMELRGQRGDAPSV